MKGTKGAVFFGMGLKVAPTTASVHTVETHTENLTLYSYMPRGISNSWINTAERKGTSYQLQTITKHI